MPKSLFKEKEKQWHKLIKDKSKLSGWKFCSFFIYKLQNNFFYETTFHVSRIDNSVWGSVAFKPFDVDMLFWDIVDLSTNKNLPLSFRGNGAFVLKAKKIFDFDVAIPVESLENGISSLINEIDFKIEEIKIQVTDIASFILYIQKNPDAGSKWFDIDILIVAFMLQFKYNEALSLLDDAKTNRKMGGWGFGDKDFYDLAIEYCQNQIKPNENILY